MLIADSLLKTIWLSMHHVIANEALATPGQTTTGKESSNPFMAGSLPKTISPMIHLSQKVTHLEVERTDEESQNIARQAPVMDFRCLRVLISEDIVKQGRMERCIFEEVYRKIMLGANTARYKLNTASVKNDMTQKWTLDVPLLLQTWFADEELIHLRKRSDVITYASKST
ncbi:hypothetical protein Tco_0294550, partial [Tanacetum coccineum]